MGLNCLFGLILFRLSTYGLLTFGLLRAVVIACTCLGRYLPYDHVNVAPSSAQILLLSSARSVNVGLTLRVVV